MAIYHLSIQNIGRSAGRSAVAAAAYRSATKLIDSERGLTCDYSRKSGVVYTEVMLCQNAPQEYADREKLWNAVEKIEKQKDARLAREINVALPRELDRETQIKIVRDYVQENFVKVGMCADIALHDKGDGNPHAHIMLTTRPIDENGKWGAKEKKVYALDEKGEKIPVIDKETGKQKIGARGRKIWQRVVADTTGWNDKENVEKWRVAWAKECNRYLSPEQAIDHRSFQRQGVERVPTIHEGAAAREIEKRTGESHKVKKNREIKEINIELSRIAKLVNVLHRQIDELKQRLAEGETDDETIRELKARLRHKKKQPNKPVEKPAEVLSVGDNVTIDGSNSVGRITAIDRNNATVAIGNFLSTVKLDKLKKTIRKETATATSKSAVAASVSDEARNRQLNFKQEIDVRGMRADEAIQAVSYFIDDAVQFGIGEVRILHGTGFGILRQRIREYLNATPDVRSYRDEHIQFGGAGITVVTLR